MLNVAFFFLSTLSTLGTGIFDKAVEWKGMFFLGCSRIFYLNIFKELPLWASVSDVSRLSLILTNNIFLGAIFEYKILTGHV